MTTAPKQMPSPTNIASMDNVAEAAIQGAEGNERLTAWAGAALLAGFAAEGLTLLDVRWYLSWHIMIGLALFAPLAVKLGSTIYRFSRYYTRSAAYRRQGPPHPLLRILAPFLVVNTLMLLLTGVAILFSGDYRHQVELLHKLSFVTWFGLTAIHVLTYVWRIPRLLLADLRAKQTRGRDALLRASVVIGFSALGLALAAGSLSWIRSWIAGD